MINSIRKIYVSALVCVFAMLSVVDAASFDGKIKKNGFKKYADNEIIVKFKNNVSSQKQMSAVSSMGDASIRSLHKNMLHVKLENDETVENAVNRYKNNADVEYAQPNYIYSACAVPNDTNYGQLWGLNNKGQTISNEAYETNNPGTSGNDMDMQKAWDVTTDCSSIIVAVIDSGVNYNHEDLSANMWHDDSGNVGYDFVDDDSEPMDLNGHGTHVSGTIAAVGNNGTGIAGICWSAQIMAVRVLDSTGTGNTADIIAGLDYAVENGASVVNCSFGYSGDVVDTAFSAAIADARTAGLLIIAAAGNNDANNDSTTKFYPASFTQDNIISVAALDQSYALASFSNYGAISVDVGAPGTNVMSSVAGATGYIFDDFNTSGTLDWTEAGGLQWAYRYLTDGTNYYDFLAVPSTWKPSHAGGYYGNSWDAQVYKSFTLTGNEDKVSVQFYADINTQIYYDFFRIYYTNDSSNPVTSGTMLDQISGNTAGNFYSFNYDMPNCIGSTKCTIGFQLETNSTSSSYYGVGIYGEKNTSKYFYLETLTLNNSTYSVYNGTSMAAPHVTGVAAMLLAYNHGYGYNYIDAINAIKNGGEDQASLSGKTSTGKSVNAYNALCYINTPTSLTVSAN